MNPFAAIAKHFRKNIPSYAFVVDDKEAHADKPSAHTGGLLVMDGMGCLPQEIDRDRSFQVVVVENRAYIKSLAITALRMKHGCAAPPLTKKEKCFIKHFQSTGVASDDIFDRLENDGKKREFVASDYRKFKGRWGQ